MFCSNCGHKLTNADIAFCTQCGVRVSVAESRGANSISLSKRKTRNNRTLIAGILASVAVVSVLIFALLLFGDSVEEGLPDVAEMSDEVASALVGDGESIAETEGELILSPDPTQHGRWAEEYLRILNEMQNSIGSRIIFVDWGAVGQFVLDSMRSVSFVDLTNDEIPELVFIAGYIEDSTHIPRPGFSSLYVYTYFNGQTHRLANIEILSSGGGGDSGTSHIAFTNRDNSLVAATTYYFPGNEWWTFYIFNDILFDPEIIRFVHQYWTSWGDYFEPEYTINNEWVTRETFEAELNRIYDGAEFWIAGSQPTFNHGNFRNEALDELVDWWGPLVETTDLSMSFDEAIRYLNRHLPPPSDGYITIRGVQFSTSLTSLDFREFDITDLTDADIVPLQHMTNLTELNLNNNSIRDITPLSGLTNLRSLRLRQNNIGDLTPLAGLSNLVSLDLGFNSIGDITALSGLTSLTHLDLHWNSIGDLNPLSGLTNLRSLDLAGSNLWNLDPLAGLHNLERLHLNGTGIVYITALSRLTNLTSLELNMNGIIDVTPLAGLTNLRRLVLTNNRISDITPLAGLPSDVILNIFGNHITDWSPVSHIEDVNGRP